VRLDREALAPALADLANQPSPGTRELPGTDTPSSADTPLGGKGVGLIAKAPGIHLARDVYTWPLLSPRAKRARVGAASGVVMCGVNGVAIPIPHKCLELPKGVTSQASHAWSISSLSMASTLWFPIVLKSGLITAWRAWSSGLIINYSHLVVPSFHWKTCCAEMHVPE
jgi:hypothetical protein